MTEKECLEALDRWRSLKMVKKLYKKMAKNGATENELEEFMSLMNKYILREFK